MLLLLLLLQQCDRNLCQKIGTGANIGQLDRLPPRYPIFRLIPHLFWWICGSVVETRDVREKEKRKICFIISDTHDFRNKKELGEKRSRHLSGTPLTFVKDLPNNTCPPFSSVWGLLVQTNEAHVKSRCSLPPTVNQVTAYSSSAAAGGNREDRWAIAIIIKRQERKKRDSPIFIISPLDFCFFGCYPFFFTNRNELWPSLQIENT